VYKLNGERYESYPLEGLESMYDLNRGEENQPITLDLNREEKPDFRVRAEFGACLHAITPRVWVTPALVGINVLVFLAMVLSGVNPLEPTTDSLLRWGADFGPRTVTDGEWWRLVTSMFLHIGLIHLAFNMYVLWQGGRFIERLLGNAGFLIVYLISGLMGALVSIAWKPYVVSAGASGAIFGLYGALLGFLVIRHDSIPATVLQPLSRSALVFLGYNLVYGLLNTGTDVADHVGGLVGGVLCGLVVALPLTIDPMPRRVGRNLAVLFGGCILCLAAATRLPRPADFQAEIQNFAAVEKKAIATYNSTLNDVRNKKLTDEQVADSLEKDILPPWEAEHQKLASLKGLPVPAETLVTSLLKYMDTRKAGWSLMVQGTRAHNSIQ
jgi:rhomboid protease GluP